MKKILAFTVVLVFPLLSSAWILPKGSLNGDDFNSETLKGKTFVLFYVSPKKKELNMDASEELKAQKFNKNVFGSVAVIDLKSSWIPNSLIMRAIKAKQVKYPRTIYLKDKKRYLHKAFDFKPTGNEIFAFDQSGKMIFRHLGKADSDKVKELITIMKASVKEASKKLD